MASRLVAVAGVFVSFAGLAALPAGLGSAGAEEPAAPVAYSDVSAVSAMDAPLLLHLRFEADGRVGLRSALIGAATLAWAERVTVNLGATAPDAQADALRTLHGALLAAHADAALVPLRGSVARVIIDAHPEALWRHVQWALASAASPDLRLWRLSFVGALGAPRLDVELPRDRGGPPAPEPVLEVEAKLLRKSAEGGAAFTRLRLAVRPSSAGGPFKGRGGERPRPKVLDGGTPPGEAPKAPAPSEGRPLPEPGVTTLDLPQTSSAAMIEAGWGEVRRSLAAALTGDLPRTALIQTPPPDGARVAVGDVLRLMALLRSLNVGAILFEGAAPPSRADAPRPAGPVGSEADRGRLRVLREQAPDAGHLLLGLRADGPAQLAVYAPRSPVTPGLDARDDLGPLGEGALPALQRLLGRCRAHPVLGPALSAPAGIWRSQVLAEADVPWRAIQQALVAAIKAGCRLGSVTFLDPAGEEPFELPLPLDGAAAAREAGLVVRLSAHDAVGPTGAAFTRVRVAEDVTVDLPRGGLPPPGPALDARRNVEAGLLARVRERVARARAEAELSSPPPFVVTVSTPPPQAGWMPWRDVLLVLRAVRAAGVEAIQVEGPIDESK